MKICRQFPPPPSPLAINNPPAWRTFEQLTTQTAGNSKAPQHDCRPNPALLHLCLPKRRQPRVLPLRRPRQPCPGRSRRAPYWWLRHSWCSFWNPSSSPPTPALAHQPWPTFGPIPCMLQGCFVDSPCSTGRAGQCQCLLRGGRVAEVGPRRHKQPGVSRLPNPSEPRLHTAEARVPGPREGRGGNSPRMGAP